MKPIIFIAGLFLVHTALFAQSENIDNLRQSLKSAKHDTDKVNILWQLGQEYQVFKPDTALLLGQEGYKLATKLKYTEGASNSLTVIANAYNRTGNYPKALTYYIKVLKIEEARNMPEKLATIIMNIATVYHLQGDEKKALSFALRADSVINQENIEWLKVYSLLNLGDIYEKSGKISDALEYTQKAYALAEESEDQFMMGSALNNLGNVYSKKGNTLLAVSNYTQAIYYLELTNDEDFIAESSIGLAKQYALLGKNDSAEFYAKKSYDLSEKNGFLSRQLEAAAFLNLHYKKLGDIKNAYAYQEQTLLLKDSIYSKDRITNAQIITMEEELRQKEILERKIAEAEKRIVHMQYLAIGILLPFLFFVTLFLSKKKIKPKYVEFLGVFSLLLTFEFIMLFIDPLIAGITYNLPILQIAVFAVIALIITPVHDNIKHWLLQKIAQVGKKQPAIINAV